ncbi:MAG: T9SS type A sorting domain-containing protein [candidate division WOR-3 bacterium]
MRISNKIYSLFFVWLLLFSNANAQISISPNYPFFNSMKSDSQQFIISGNATFNKVFVCAPREAYAWIVNSGISIVDFNKNGLNDIPFTAADDTVIYWSYSWPGRVYIASQTSPGSFQCIAITNSDKDTPYGITILDYDFDGYLDLVYASARSNGIYRLKNWGSNFFSESQITQGAGFPNHVAVRKLNVGYGIAVLYTDENFRLYEYNLSTNSINTLNTSCREGLAVGDINGDGLQDVVCGSGSGFYTNDGKGYLYYQLNSNNGWSQVYQLSSVYGRWHGIALGDLNKDNKLDVVSCRGDDDRVYVFYNNGGNPPIFTLITSISTGADFTECEVRIADIDCDGDYDIVWTNGYDFVQSGPSIGWIENNTWINRVIEIGTYQVYGAAVGYVNSDKKPDIVAGLRNNLYIYYNTTNVSDASCAPITPVDIPEGFEINAEIEVKGKEIKFILNRNINDKLDIFDVSGKKLWTYYINGQQLIFRIPNSGVYIVRLRDKSYKVVVK